METKVTCVYIDSCAWDVLYDCGVDLSNELKSDEFTLCLTKEVADFEMSGGFDNKPGLQEYFEKYLSCLKVTRFFGFQSYSDSPKDKPRTLGFGSIGDWLTYETGEPYAWFTFSKEGKQRPTGLYQNEADASLAAISCSGAVVITSDRKGRLKDAKENRAGRVVYIDKSILKKSSLRDLVRAAT